MVLAIFGAGLIVFGTLLVLPYVGSLTGAAAYGYFPVTPVGGLGIFLVAMGLIASVIAIAVRNTTSAVDAQTNEDYVAPAVGGPLRNLHSSLDGL